MIDFANDIPRVELDFMNADHEHMVAQLNALLDLLHSAASEDTVTPLLLELMLHCDEHFARENRQMEQHGFPPYSCHKGEHDRVLAELAEVIQQWRQQPDSERLRGYVLDTLLPWFKQHVATMDSMTAMYIQRVAGEAVV